MGLRELTRYRLKCLAGTLAEALAVGDVAMVEVCEAAIEKQETVLRILDWDGLCEDCDVCEDDGEGGN